jgi:glycosyltransferase Alg8
MNPIAHGIYILAAAAIASTVPASAFSGGAGVFLTLGVIGLWRYSWALFNFVRAHVYIRIAYPRRRAAAEALYNQRRPAHAFFLATSYKIDGEITARVYRSIFLAARRSRGGATVVASVVDIADERLIRNVAQQVLAGIDTVEVVIDRIEGTGKRDALATSLRSIARRYPSANDVVLLIDGDTQIPSDIVERAAPFFAASKVGALTTHERAEIDDKPLFRDWFKLRFTQRQMMMSAVALGGRVLTLTGRMSVFRADLATDPEFIASVEQDYIDHWRLGRVKFLTGDDKSTWFWLLRNGYEMAYLPDVACVSMETQPKAGFVESAVTLMRRWFGNMLRTNGRALALGPQKIGLFAWWSILDQRVSMWTTLTAPVGIVLFSVFVDPLIAVAYIAWVMATRYAYCWLLATFGGPFPITYPFLLYFGQLFGAAIKTSVLFRLDRQRWTRQSTSIATPAGREGRARSLASSYMHVLALGLLVAGVIFVTGLLSPFPVHAN